MPDLLIERSDGGPETGSFLRWSSWRLRKTWSNQSIAGIGLLSITWPIVMILLAGLAIAQTGGTIAATVAGAALLSFIAAAGSLVINTGAVLNEFQVNSDFISELVESASGRDSEGWKIVAQLYLVIMIAMSLIIAIFTLSGVLVAIGVMFVSPEFAAVAGFAVGAISVEAEQWVERSSRTSLADLSVRFGIGVTVRLLRLSTIERRMFEVVGPVITAGFSAAFSSPRRHSRAS